MVEVREDEVFNTEVEFLLQAILHQFHYDFTHYTRSSIRRRVAYSLERFNLPSVSRLQERLLHDRDFFPQLLNYLTVPTTEMFRDPTYFQSLREEVVPLLKTYPSLKIWIAGCSTGEEIYSLTILLKEERLLDKTLIYATDINPNVLSKAKMGIFDAEVIQTATKNYQLSGGKGSLSDYYTAQYGAVKMDPSLTKKVLFTDHSLATDNVFSEVQFVSCRNVLIYFDRDLQDRAFSLFEESLPHGGILGLGSKESIQFSSIAEKFHPLVKEDKIYQKV